MEKVFNLMVQVVVKGDSREAIVKKLDDICSGIDSSIEENGGDTLGAATVDGYWDSKEEYLAGADCRDDDCWEE